MEVYEARSQLRRVSGRELFELVLNRRISNCLIGGRLCGFLFQYEGSNFCVSEISGKGCQIERSKQLEQLYDEKEEVNASLPFPQKIELELLSPRKKALEFKVYHRDHLTHSAVLLGKIIERRREERGDNIKALLKKAMKQYSDQVKGPSTMFLLEG